jgi:hypothetical protein
MPAHLPVLLRENYEEPILKMIVMPIGNSHKIGILGCEAPQYTNFMASSSPA